MKAKDISGLAPGGKRTQLAKVLPLDAPFVVQIFPAYACNFSCKYCIFSVDKKKRHFISEKIFLDFGLYKKCIDDIALFPNKAKVLRFVGIGEPLLHKKIADMVTYAASKDAAKTIEILTNAILLTPQMSDKLIKGGLTRLVVSLQGTTAAKYKDVCGKRIDFQKLLDNLRYFFEHKGKAQVYIKIIDCALEGKNDERKFREVFGDICDTLAIEYAVPIHSSVDYKNVVKRKSLSLTQFGLPVAQVKVCPQPFFTMQINPDGKVVPCYSFEYPRIMGDCNSQSVREIWTGKKFQSFRRKMLDGIRSVCEICAQCNIIKYRLFPEDSIHTKDAKRLKKFYEPR